MIYRLNIVFLSLLTLLLVSCSRSRYDSSGKVAKVGSREISSEELRYAYEFAPSSVTQLGKDRASAYLLDGIIETVLLSIEARKRNLDNDLTLQKFVEHYKRKAIVRELYLKHIRDSVTVSENEKRRGFQRSKTTLYVQNFISSDLDAAVLIRQGKLTASHTPINPLLETVEFKDQGLVDIVGWNILGQEIEDILFKLPVGMSSDPFFNGNVYHIFKVVEKETEALQRESDYLTSNSSISAAIRKRKEHSSAYEYVKRVMKPQNLILKAEPLSALSDYFWRSKSNRDPQLQYLETGELKSFSGSHEDLMNLKIALFSSGNLTVEDFLFNYRFSPAKISFKTKGSLTESLKNAIATYVRDYVFAETGIKEGLHECKSVREEERKWNEQLLARKVKEQIYAQVAEMVSDPSELESEYNRKMEELMDKLQKKTNIVIFDEVVDKIQTSDEGLRRKIDFFATYTQ